MYIESLIRIYNIAARHQVMGVYGVILGVTLAITIAMTIYTIMNMPNNNGDDLSPVSEFQATIVQEGVTVPLIYGKMRVNSNLIWYGNYRAVPQGSLINPLGGKGGGDSNSSAGTYYTVVDAWFGIGQGKLSIVDYYVKDKNVSPDATINYNDGTQSYYPTAPGAKATKLKGVAHIFLADWNLGQNATYMPVVHFVVEKDLSGSPVSYPNLINGNNPAAIVYDILLESGVSADKIDLPSFNAAATFWYNKGLGLNLSFTSQQKAYQMIDKVMKYVDGLFFESQEGLYKIKAYDPTDVYSIEIRDKDFKDKNFVFNRKTWGQVPNHFVYNYTDQSLDYTQRTIQLQNPAAIEMAGVVLKETIDLKAFRDRDTAVKVATEIRNKNSYPASAIQIKGNLKLALIEPGTIARIYNTRYGINGADFRVISSSSASVDTNEITLDLVQVTETLFDDNYITPPLPTPYSLDFSPIPLTKTRVFELPYTARFGKEPTFLFLAAREKLSEISFIVEKSLSPTGDYTVIGELNSWSQAATLSNDYSSNTYKIDDSLTGLEITAYIDDPSFLSTTRDNLFTYPRYIIINDEMMSFQNIDALGGNQFRITGIIRGVFNTPIQTHLTGDDVFLTWVANNVATIDNDTFYIKILPRIGGNILAEGLVSAITVNKANKAKQSRAIGRAVINRTTTTNCDVQIFPSTPTFAGAGTDTESVVDFAPPFNFSGGFEVVVNGGTAVEYVTDSFSLTVPSTSFTLAIRHKLEGVFSETKSVTIDTSLGNYYI